MRVCWPAAVVMLVSFALLYLACDGERIPVEDDNPPVEDVTGNQDVTVPPADSIADDVQQEVTPPDLQLPEDLSFVDVGDGPGDILVEDTLLPDVILPCPDSPPIGDGACTPGTSCAYGEECCCGECYDSLVCNCADDGTFACYNTDACYGGGGWCDPPCCDTGTGDDPCLVWVEGMSCQAMPGTDQGKCLKGVKYPSCWNHDNCAADEQCEGADVCPCNADCDMEDTPGKCVDPDQAGDVGDPCGQNGGECKEGLVCCYPCGIPGCIFECSEPCDATEPWCEGGCPMYA